MLALPENLTGEILNGRLHTQPRPSRKHVRTASVLGGKIGGPFDFGPGGPGGWWILDKPEIHFIRDVEVCVPDLAGWRRERLPDYGGDDDGYRFEVVPDWVCEILSPSTESKDRQIKMGIYAKYGVSYAWLVDPAKRVLEAYGLRENEWGQVGTWSHEDKAHVPPFHAIELALSMLWV